MKRKLLTGRKVRPERARVLYERMFLEALETFGRCKCYRCQRVSLALCELREALPLRDEGERERCRNVQRDGEL